MATPENNRRYYLASREQQKARCLSNYHRNPAASKARIKRWKKESPESAARSIKKTNLRKFGLTPAQYELMFLAQGGACAICQRPETRLTRGRVQSLSVDHCHKTMKVRGLLCNQRNLLLGHAKDSTAVLRVAIEYLEAAGD